MPNSHILYENAPLIEVLAEIKWHIMPLESMPGMAVDPHFSAFSDDFKKEIGNCGFSSAEKIVPERIPLEFMPFKVIFQFREKPKKWPLFQIGPGLLTANTIPPYEGWECFKNLIYKGLFSLYKAYPYPERYLRISSIELRYIDGFTRDHGYEKYRHFVKENLGIEGTIPKRIVENYVSFPEDILISQEIMMDLNTPELSNGFIKISPGKKENNEAVFSELIIRKETKLEQSNPDSLLAWFDQAHTVLRDWFEIMTSDQLKKNMKPFMRNVR